MTAVPPQPTDEKIAEWQRLCDQATPAPWYFANTSIQSEPKLRAVDDFWTDERIDDEHTYEHRAGQVCPGCGPRLFTYPSGKQGQYWDCAHAPEALDAEPTVARVAASYGDTATGQRVADAEFIAAAREGWPATLAALRDARAENQRLAAHVTEAVGLALADSDLDEAAYDTAVRALARIAAEMGDRHA